MTAKRSDMSFLLKVLCLLSVCFGSAQSTTTVSIQPSATVTNSFSGSVNVSTISASVTSGSLNTMEAPSPSSVDPAQSSRGLGNPNNNNNNNNNGNNNNNNKPSEPVEQELEEDFAPLIQELDGIITREVDPTKSKPKDVNVIETLSKMMEEGLSLLIKYNDSGNTTVDFFNVTEGTSFVLVMKKFDCITQRKVAIPDRSDESTGEALEKFTDYVSARFDCPRIVKNATHPLARRRRDVQIEVTMEISAEDEGDFHEFQMLHHHSRIRRNAQQCGSQRCGVQRFETILVITNRTFDAALQDSSSAYYKELEKQLTDTLKAKLQPFLDVQKVKIIEFDARAQDVKAKLYLDVRGTDIVSSNVTDALTDAAVNDTLGQLEVDPATFQATHRIVVNGNYTEWTKWSEYGCDNNFDTKRTRQCLGPQHGGQCFGPAEEIRKCDCTFNETQGGNISSPLFPNNYPNGVKCVWVLEAPVNHTVKLDLEEFHLEKDKKCFYDYMEFFDGDTEEHLQIGNRFCGRNFPQTVESTGQKLLVVFNADKSENYKGFRAVWETRKIKKKVIEYVEQYVTALVMMYSPAVNDTHYPLGTATTCSEDSQTIDKECIFDDKVFIISRLISAHIDRNLPLDGNNRIVVNFEHIMNEKLFPAIYNGEKQCVSWNEKAKLQTSGAWTKRGCSVLTTNITHTSCACDHPGLFAVVGKEKIEPQKLRLLANTYIGIGISFFILILAIVHIVWKIEIHGGEVMRINMCAAIIVMQSVFLIGAHVKAQQTLCGFLSFAVYFSVLAEFCWLLLHGLRIHGKIKKIFASNLNIEIVYVVIGWGLPLLLALIAIGVQIDLKNPDDVCWEAAAGSAMWGYAGPVIIIALFNVAVLLKLLIPTEDVKNGYDYVEMRYRVIKDFVFLAFFGLTCTMAYQAVEKERFTEQYFLSGFVVMQAIAMFVFGREGRKDFIKRPVEDVKPDETTAENQAVEEEPTENIYENVDDLKPAETDLGEGSVKRSRKKKKISKKDLPEKITVPTLKNLNIYKEGGQYVIEA
ncbi:uncharacterized protein LOC144654853 isoform X2 [Oculina patagonica]